MSTYEMGAFEALEWAWNVLRTQDTVEADTTNRIKDMLFKLGSGSPVDFKQQINEIKTLQ